MLQEEKEQNVKEREEALAERISPLNLSGLSAQELVVMIDYNIFVVSQSLQFLLPPDSNTLSFLLMDFLQDLCKGLHHKIDLVDEERYDIGLKVSKNDMEVRTMGRGVVLRQLFL